MDGRLGRRSTGFRDDDPRHIQRSRHRTHGHDPGIGGAPASLKHAVFGDGTLPGYRVQLDRRLHEAEYLDEGLLLVKRVCPAAADDQDLDLGADRVWGHGRRWVFPYP